jgi:general secretion pathway protein D
VRDGVRSRPLWRAAVLAGLVLASCRVAPPDIQPLPQPLAQPAGNLGAAARVSGRVGPVAATPPAQIAYGQTGGASYSLAPGAGGIADGGPADITLDFADTDIREVVRQVLGNILHVNYTIDPSVRGTASFHTAEPLSRGNALGVLQALLAQNNATLVQNANLYRVVPAAQAVSAGPAGSDIAAGSQVIPLRYASAEALAKLLTPFATQGGKIAADPGQNAVVVAGEPGSRAALAALVESFDVNELAGQSYAMLPVTSGDAKDFATALQDAMRGGANGSLAGLVRVIPLDRLNAVLVVSQQPGYIESVRRVYDLVEKQRRFTVRSWHVYYLQNSHAMDAAYVLQQAFTPQHVTAQPTSAGSTAPGGGTAQLGGQGGGGGLGGGGLSGAGGLGGGVNGGGVTSGGLSGGGLSGGLGGNGLSGGSLGGGLTGAQGGQGQGNQAAAASSTANPLLGGLDTGGGAGEGGEAAQADSMRIIPNTQNNALLIYATPQEEDTIESMLHKIDILPLQVRIDATIAEVTLNDALQYGTQYFFKEGDINQTLSTGTTTGTVNGILNNNAINAAFPGFILGATAHNAAAAISALQNVTKVNVLSSPELMVLDNQPAHLQVGSLVPYLASSAQSTVANSEIVNQVQYQPTGVILNVTPRVNSGGLVTLDISQEVSEVAEGTTTPGLNSPTFDERDVLSRVVVQDGQTIGLAGLIQENVTHGNSGIPWLKDVPLLGLIAGSQNNSRVRTELLVLITPHVVHDQRDAEALTEDLREQMPNAALLPGQLSALPLSGSPDPSQRLRSSLGLGP